MKETKRRLETFSFYDRTGLEEHLAAVEEAKKRIGLTMKKPK